MKRSMVLVLVLLVLAAVCAGCGAPSDDVPVTHNGDSGTQGDNNSITEATDEQINSPVEILGTYVFGEYEQDNDLGNGKEPIEWIVLDKNEEGILLLSKFALDCQPYHNEHMSINWEECSLRSWLNESFYDAAFTDSQKAMIKDTMVTPDNHDSCSGANKNQGPATVDKVFVLGVTETEAYLPKMLRDCQPTAYATAQGAFVSSNLKGYEGNCWWWLRTSLRLNESSALVYVTGTINCGCGVTSGSMVDSKGGTVRPAIWIEAKG